MVEPLPTFEQVLEPMQSPKPPIACRVVELDGGSVRRTATVLFDGLQGWYIDDGARVEVRSSDESVLFDSDGKICCPRSMGGRKSPTSRSTGC
jgi:hypothetical protein